MTNKKYKLTDIYCGISKVSNCKKENLYYQNQYRFEIKIKSSTETCAAFAYSYVLKNAFN
ncbi:MAG: hypothetical protein EOP00_35710 [Pedobacter sp.]|nr:MAG: hypothetical protein EOP00_35710 [Pedobacter sp.]